MADFKEEKGQLEQLLKQLPREQPEEQELKRQNNLLFAQLERKRQQKEISLCYLPMLLNLLVSLLFGAAACVLLPFPMVQIAAAVLAVVSGVAGAVITRVGIRFFDLKKRLTVCLKKG